ncbi:MAG: energy transducer TonB [Treponema sp.]|jgi:TonB family protein|nr:energy transducer TonB [Treponema sp.]
MRKTELARLVLFAAAAAAQALLIFFFKPSLDAPLMARRKTEAPALMKLAFFKEEKEPPQAPPSPPSKTALARPAESQTAKAALAAKAAAEAPVEAAAEIETEEAPDPGTAPAAALAAKAAQKAKSGEEYLPMYRVSVLPVFREKDILAALVYPGIALRSRLEGAAYLELLVDRRGEVKRIAVLKENPPGLGFGEAAANAFRGRRGKPAEANGVPVGVIYRYPVRFKLKN